MNHFYSTLKTLAIGLAVMTSASTVSAAVAKTNDSPYLPKSLTADHYNREFRGDKPFSVKDFDTKGLQRKAAVKPTYQFNDLPRFDYLEGPDGSTWFYTAEYDFETVVHNPYWSEDLIKAFTFTIYDSQFNLVGKIHDKITFAPNETRAREILLDAAVSTRFFNEDDKPELMVQHVMNTEEYINHYYYKVYSIGGDKDSEGNDVCIATVEGKCADAINVGDKDNENFYFTFITDPVINFTGTIPSAAYIEYLNTLTYKVDTYSKANGTGSPQLVFSKDIYVTRVPGDTTDGIYLITKKVDGKLYLIYSQYEKPLFVEPVLLNGDESQTPGNSFVIEAYVLDGKSASSVSKTVIPLDYPDSSDALRYVYYSIGSVSWSNDVDMSVNGTPSAPAYIVAHDIESVSTESLTSNYEIYDNSGKLVRTIASDTESLRVFAVDGGQPQAMFVNKLGEEAYQFSFYNLYSGDLLFALDQQNDGDPLMEACALVRSKDGSLNYVFEMRNNDFDSEGNTYIRAAWFDAKGKPVRIDRINMGLDVQAAMINLDPAGLHPDIYDNDDAMEYAILVKRTFGSSGTTRNEYMVVDDNGDALATFTADDGRGDPTLFTLLPGEKNRLMMVYLSYYGFNVDLYDLPFVNDDNSVSDITGSDAAAITFDGQTVSADGEICVYSTTGVLVAKGRDNVNVSKLEQGVYVVTAGKKAVKIRL